MPLKSVVIPIAVKLRNLHLMQKTIKLYNLGEEMKDQDKVRERVSKTYAKAITNTQQSCCCLEPTIEGILAEFAGYGKDELNSIPKDAVANSFGCGNPVAFSGVQPGDVVLDLGSGAGIDLILAGQKVGPTGQVIGIDMTDEMIERAKDNIAQSGLANVEVRKGIIEELPVDSASVDWVISNCVINLSPNKEAVFKEINKVLKPGGKMLVSDIVVENLPDWILTRQELWDSCIAGAISEKDYLAGLKKAGLEDIEVRDRLYYDASQMKGLIESELPENLTSCCGGGAIDPEAVKKIASEVEGKICSVNVFARKPE